MDEYYLFTEPRPALSSGKGMDFYRQAAETGDREAQFCVGYILHCGGYGVERNFQEAAFWYQFSADQLHAGAQNNLAILLDRGQGIGEDTDKAMKFFELADQQGSYEASFNIGSMYHRTRGVEKDDEKETTAYLKALNLNRPAAEKGDAIAQYNMGRLYESLITGLVIRFDHQLAEKWYRLAAHQGHTDATYRLSYCLRWYSRKEVGEDPGEEKEWLLKAAGQGNMEAQVTVWESVFTAEKIKHKALYSGWLKEAAHHGHPRAQDLLGTLYKDDPEFQDFKQALYWYNKAIDQGYRFSGLHIGDMYAEGMGFQKDNAAALRCYINADCFGCSIRIANIYSIGGYGVKKDENLAEHYRILSQEEDDDLQASYIVM